MAKTMVQEFTKGLWEEIPPFRLVLGLCPVLAVTKTVENGIGANLNVSSGLELGETIVAAGVASLSGGQKVRPWTK